MNIMYNYNDEVDYDDIALRLIESGVSVIVLIAYVNEVTEYFTRMNSSGYRDLLLSDRVIYFGCPLIDFL